MEIQDFEGHPPQNLEKIQQTIMLQDCDAEWWRFYLEIVLDTLLEDRLRIGKDIDTFRERK